jgi:hypothetical protein
MDALMPPLRIGQTWIYTKIDLNEMMAAEEGRRAFNVIRCQ